MGNYSKLITSTLIVFILLFLEPILGSFTSTDFLDHSHWPVIKRNLLIAIAAWVLIEVTSLLKRQILKRYDLAQEDNLDARKLHTQLNLLEKVVIFVIILIAVAFIMLSIDGIRQIGIGIFASAGVAGIIIGLSAQKVVGALLAGILIAITTFLLTSFARNLPGYWKAHHCGIKK